MCSRSTAPSLRGGDWILAWRLTEPGLGSLVLCPEPKHTERLTIGRLIGDERDRVKVEGTRITINERGFRTEGSCAQEHFKVDAPQGPKDVEQRCAMEVAHGIIHMRGEAEETAGVPDLVGLGGGNVGRHAREPPVLHAHVEALHAGVTGPDHADVLHEEIERRPCRLGGHVVLSLWALSGC